MGDDVTKWWIQVGFLFRFYVFSYLLFNMAENSLSTIQSVSEKDSGSIVEPSASGDLSIVSSDPSRRRWRRKKQKTSRSEAGDSEAPEDASSNIITEDDIEEDGEDYETDSGSEYSQTPPKTPPEDIDPYDTDLEI